MNLFILRPEEISGDTGLIRGSRADYLKTALGISPGSIIRIGLINGPIGQAQIEELTNDHVRLRCQWEHLPPRLPAIDVILAMPRPKAMKRLWSALAMLAVRRIAIVNAENVERCYFDSHVLQPSFIESQFVIGLEQAQHTFLPSVRIEKRLKVFLEDSLADWTDASVRLLADPLATNALPDERVKHSGGAVVAIGPEAGWTNFECELFEKHGFYRFSLGDLTLRTDVAVIAIVSILRYILIPQAPLGRKETDRPCLA